MLKYLVKKILKSEVEYKNIIYNSKGNKITFINPYSYHLVRKNTNLYEKFDGIFIDGFLMCVFIKLFYNKKISRRSFDMTTVAKDLFSNVEKNGKNIFLVGAKWEEIKSMVKNIYILYPNINIVGYRSGFFNSEDEYDNCINKILSLNPDYVIVGMGAILQEKFLVDLSDGGFLGTGFTCGGYIRQASAGLTYFPYWSNKYNLRWLYRLYKEKGVFKRLYNVLLEFPLLFLWDYIKEK